MWGRSNNHKITTISQMFIFKWHFRCRCCRCCWSSLFPELKLFPFTMLASPKPSPLLKHPTQWSEGHGFNSRLGLLEKIHLVPRGILPFRRKRRGKEVVEIHFHKEIQQFLFFFVLLAFIHSWPRQAPYTIFKWMLLIKLTDWANALKKHLWMLPRVQLT